MGEISASLKILKMLCLDAHLAQWLTNADCHPQPYNVPIGE